MAKMIDLPSYTKELRGETYAAIDPKNSNLSTAGKVVLITGASGGIGQSTAWSFAASKPKALILLGRDSDRLAETANSEKCKGTVVRTHAVDLCGKKEEVREVFDKVAQEFGRIDILVHAAGVLAPIIPLLEVDPANFVDQGYKTTITSTLSVAQAVVLANKKFENREGLTTESVDQTTGQAQVLKDLTFINLTTAGIFFPPFNGMGAYVSSKMAAVKLLECFAAENKHIRLHHVHPGMINTNMSQKLPPNLIPFEYDEISLPSDFLVWIASDEAKFLDGKLVLANWDVEELKSREKEILDTKERPGDLWFGLRGFPRHLAPKALRQV